MIRGQSGAAMLDIFGAPPLRTWSVHCLPGMLPNGQTVKTFTSLSAFDGYVGQLRALGLSVSFDNPVTATVTPCHE